MTAFDLICVGSSFASCFFLEKWLKLAPAGAKALVLERGPDLTHERIRNGSLPSSRGSYRDEGPSKKPWAFTLAVGGSSNCWVGNTPRLMPNDFRQKSLYGVGADWPIQYEDLEPYYAEAESIMGIAGPETTPFPRKGPYPLGPHRLNDFDRALKKAWPDSVFPIPTARPSAAFGGRPRCCASSFCQRCPIDSKFTIKNGMPVLANPRVTLHAASEVLSLDVEAGQVVGVRGLSNGREFRERGHLIVLGANAIFNAAILLRSSSGEGDVVGRGLTEQLSIRATAYTRGLQSMDGSTYLTGHGYMFYDGAHRRDTPACLVETSNAPELRDLRDRWRDIGRFKLIFEDIRRPDNRVTIDGDGPPRVHFAGYSDFALRGLREAKKLAEKLVEKLPLDSLSVAERPQKTESHVMCTAPMGTDAKDSVVDANLVHHKYRNVVVAGASAFPNAPAANPTLTLSALSLRSAARILGA